MKQWKAQQQYNLQYIGPIELEHPTDQDEYIYFEIYKSDTHLIFGGHTNTGLLESGNYEIDPDFSLDENLQELIEDITEYYRSNSATFCSDRFSCNDRM